MARIAAKQPAQHVLVQTFARSQQGLGRAPFNLRRAAQQQLSDVAEQTAARQVTTGQEHMLYSHECQAYYVPL